MMSGDEIHLALDRLLKRPVAFFPVFSQIGGSVNAGVMLSQLWYWSDGRGWNEEGWIWKTSKEWAKETTLSESEVEGARKKLVERGLIRYKRAGLPAKPHYLLNKQAVLDAVIALRAHKNASFPNSGKQDEPDCGNKTDEKQDSGSPISGNHNTKSSSKITPTPQEPAGGAGDGISCKTKTTAWQEGECHVSLDEFIAAAFWMQRKAGGVRNPPGFKSAVRKRIAADGPSEEDWDSFKLWRASHVKVTPTENPEDANRVSEKKPQLADAKQRYVAMDVSQQKEIESRFAVYIQAANKFVYKIYSKSGLESGVVAGAFHDWFAGELQ